MMVFFSWLALEAKGLKCRRRDVPLKLFRKYSPYTHSQEVPSLIYTIFSLFTSTVWEVLRENHGSSQASLKDTFYGCWSIIMHRETNVSLLDLCKNTEMPQDKKVLDTWKHFLSALLLQRLHQHLCWAGISGGIKCGRRYCGNAAIW